MDYMDTAEAAAQWRVTVRQVQRLLSAGRIPGAIRLGGGWLIPSGMPKPGKARLSEYVPAVALPREYDENAFANLEISARALVNADIAYHRGDTGPAKAYWREIDSNDGHWLASAALTTAAAITSDDYVLFGEVSRALNGMMAKERDPRNLALLSLPGALAAVSMAAITPKWLADCDFFMFDKSMRPYLLYMYALHLRNLGDYPAMYHTANAVLLLTEDKSTFTWLDVQLGVTCACAAYAMNKTETARRHLNAALDIALPWGFLQPFSDNLGDLGGLLEHEAEKRDPALRARLVNLWNVSFKNWMRFHNDFCRDNITTVLTARQYQVAHMIAGGATYSETARRMGLSAGRVKNVISEVFSKLYIEKKSELRSFVL